MYSNILLPIVFDKEHDPQSAFDVAKALARPGATMTVLHVMEDIPGYAAAQVPEGVIAANHAEIERSVADLAATLPGAKGVVIRGHSGASIVQFAKDRDMDCIVMASHKPGLENFFLGSTADRVVRHAKCAVHVLR